MWGVRQLWQHSGEEMARGLGESNGLGVGEASASEERWEAEWCSAVTGEQQGWHSDRVDSAAGVWDGESWRRVEKGGLREDMGPCPVQTFGKTRLQLTTSRHPLWRGRE